MSHWSDDRFGNFAVIKKVENVLLFLPFLLFSNLLCVLICAVLATPDAGKNCMEMFGKQKLKKGRKSWQWEKHACLYSDLLQALTGNL